MRRIVVIALAVACGGSIPSITATQQIKDGAGQAQQGLQSSNAALLSAAGLQNFAGGIVDNAANPSGLDLSALPNSGSMVKRAAPPPRHGPMGAMAPLRSRSAAETSLVTGCIKPDPANSNKGVMIKAGDPGCAAADHLEVDYVNGDQMNLVFTSASSSSYEIKVTMGAGSWSGTSLDYQVVASANNGGNTGVSVHAAGAMRYGTAVSADFDFTYLVSVTADSSGQTSSLQATGTSTDHPSNARLTFNWTTAIGLDVHNQLSSLSWDGSQQVDLLDGAGAVQNTVKFSGMQVRAALVLDPQSARGFDVTGYTAGGDVLWDGKRAGSVVAKDPEDVVIRWTDGTEAKIDPFALFGSTLG